MSEHTPVLSYSKIINLSITNIASTGMSLGMHESCKSASVMHSRCTMHAVLLPCPTKLDTVSQPVRARNIRRAFAFCGPRECAIL